MKKKKGRKRQTHRQWQQNKNQSKLSSKSAFEGLKNEGYKKKCHNLQVDFTSYTGDC